MATLNVFNKTMWAYILCCIMLICYFFTSDNQSEHSFYFLNYILGIVVLAPLNTVLIFILYKIGHADIYNWKHLIGAFCALCCLIALKNGSIIQYLSSL